jgi:prolyl-tRNA synthetase
LAPQHIVIIPIVRKPEEAETVFGYCEQLAESLRQQQYHGAPLRVLLDKREMNGGEKTWEHIKKGVPIRLEVGPRDIANNSVFMGRRDLGVKEKQGVAKDEFIAQATGFLDEIQSNLFKRAEKFMKENMQSVDNLEAFKKLFAGEDAPGFVQAFCSESADYEAILKPLKATARCILPQTNASEGKCIFSGESTNRQVLFAKAY